LSQNSYGRGGRTRRGKIRRWHDKGGSWGERRGRGGEETRDGARENDNEEEYEKEDFPADSDSADTEDDTSPASLSPSVSREHEIPDTDEEDEEDEEDLQSQDERGYCRAASPLRQRMTRYQGEATAKASGRLFQVLGRIAYQFTACMPYTNLCI